MWKSSRFKSEELATQAVINGQVDVGQGTPYAAIQKVNVPIRFFYQLYALQFFPVVNKEFYKSWKDLDGQEIAVHARGSGTEAIMHLMAKEQGIKYKNISYVPGSDVRALGLIRGTIKATILDSNNWNHVMKEAPDKFMILPTRRAEGERRGDLCHQGIPGQESSCREHLRRGVAASVTARSTRTRGAWRRNARSSGS